MEEIISVVISFISVIALFVYMVGFQETQKPSSAKRSTKSPDCNIQHCYPFTDAGKKCCQEKCINCLCTNDPSKVPCPNGRCLNGGQCNQGKCPCDANYPDTEKGYCSDPNKICYKGSCIDNTTANSDPSTYSCIQHLIQKDCGPDPFASPTFCT